MRILEFDVEKQRVRKKPGCDFSKIVAGSSGYLRAKFHFTGPDWSGCKKAASFWTEDEHEHPMILDNNNSCLIPADALVGDRFFVSVTGMRGTYYTIKTDRTRVKQEVT